jgi:hypothetical protein
MSLTRKKTAELNTSSTVKAAKRAQKASSAAAANAVSAAQNAALTAQNATGVAQTAAQNAAVVATNAAQNAAVVATNAAQNASDAAQTAATSLSKGVKERVYTARSWAAPRLESAAERLESAADYTSSTVAPKVSAALRSTAAQVKPADTKSSRKTVLTWSVLGAAILAALGAGAALARRRYRAAIAADSEATDEEVLSDSSGSQAVPDSPDGTPSAAAEPKDQGTETSVNGRVTATGR